MSVTVVRAALPILRAMGARSLVVGKHALRHTPKLRATLQRKTAQAATALDIQIARSPLATKAAQAAKETDKLWKNRRYVQATRTNLGMRGAMRAAQQGQGQVPINSGDLWASLTDPNHPDFHFSSDPGRWTWQSKLPYAAFVMKSTWGFILPGSEISAEVIEYIRMNGPTEDTFRALGRGLRGSAAVLGTESIKLAENAQLKLLNSADRAIRDSGAGTFVQRIARGAKTRSASRVRSLGSRLRRELKVYQSGRVLKGTQTVANARAAQKRARERAYARKHPNRARFRKSAQKRLRTLSRQRRKK